jgi:hypothetical protein
MADTHHDGKKERNDRTNAVTKFCLAMEEHRRTDAGRVRTAKEMLDVFFPRTADGAQDKVFLHIPQDVRGPVISNWGIRGPRSANRDTDEKTKQVVADALAAGDIDEAMFEQGLDAQTLVDWIPLTEWWAFWRTGKLTGVAVQKALAVGRELQLFDDRWFLENVEGRGGKLKGTDTLCDTLSKDQIIGWIRNVHRTGDGSPAGLVSALGWETVLAKTSQEALLFSLDALAKKIGLVSADERPGVAVPDGIPADLEPPSIPSMSSGVADQSLWSSTGTTAAALSEARAQMMSQLEEEAQGAPAAAQGDTMMSTPVKPSYGRDDEVTNVNPGKQPPSGRKPVSSR